MLAWTSSCLFAGSVGIVALGDEIAALSENLEFKPVTNPLNMLALSEIKFWKIKEIVKLENKQRSTRKNI